MKMVRIMKIFCLLLLPILACSQVQKFEKVKTDTLQSKTDSSFVFLNDSARIANFLLGDSTGFPASSVSFGKGRLIFRGDAGIYWQDGNSRWRLDTSYSGNFVPTGDSVTGIFYVTLKRLQDSASVWRNLIGTKADSSLALYWADTTLSNGVATDYDVSLRALKTTTITAGDGLSGGGDLSTNRTITANTKTGGSLTITTDSLQVDSTGFAATDYDVSLKLAKTDTASLSSRIDAKNVKQTWKESDGSPSIFGTDTVEIDQTKGLVETNPSGTRAKISLSQDLTTGGSPTFTGLTVTGDVVTSVGNSIYYGDNNTLLGAINDAAKGRLLYSQGLTAMPVWEDYPWLYSSTSNLGFGLTDTSINKNISSNAQSADSSAFNFYYSNLGKPRWSITNSTGKKIVDLDTLGWLTIGDTIPQPLFTTLTKLFLYLNGADCVFEMRGKNAAATGGIADMVFTNEAATSGTTRLATIAAQTGKTANTGQIKFFVKSAAADANPTAQMTIDSIGALVLNARVRGSDSYSTTATTDTVTVTDGATTDYYFITLTGTTAPVAADQSTVEALTGKFVVHRSASGTSGLTYNWFRIK